MTKVLWATVFALCAIISSASAVEWKLQRFEGRDYVDLLQLAEFYDLPRDAASAGNMTIFLRGRRSLTIVRDSREVEINGIKHWLSFPIIERDGQYWISRMDLGKTVEPAFRPETIPNLKTFTTVVLDAGHGGHDKGAASPYEFEKNFSLDVARRVRNELQKAGLQVFMTRNSDNFIELQDRASLANAKRDSIFVSIHFNAADWNRSANGFEIFCITPRGSPSTEYDDLRVRDMVQEYGNNNETQSFALANAVYHSMHGSMEMFDRGLKRARFAVLRLTKMPAILVEGGFLTNPEDAKLVANTAWRDKYAKAIAVGILEYRKMAEFKIAPRVVADYRDPKPSISVAAATPAPSPPKPTVDLQELPEEKSN